MPSSSRSPPCWSPEGISHWGRRSRRSPSGTRRCQRSIKSRPATSSSGQRFDPTGGVEVLAEPHRLFAVECPYMDERNVQLFAGSLRDTAVTARGRPPDRRRRETRPARPRTRPTTARPAGRRCSSARPRSRDTCRRGAALRLMPLDLRVHVADHAVQVVARKGVVRALHDVDGRSCCVAYGRGVRHARERRSGRAACSTRTGAVFTQRVRPFDGDCSARRRRDEVLYVLAGSGHAVRRRRRAQPRPGTARFIDAREAWSIADGTARCRLGARARPRAGCDPSAVIDLAGRAGRARRRGDSSSWARTRRPAARR